MRIVKRLYLFVLKSFLPLFAMTFFIVLFIVLMQFLWKYIDDLVGKGLEFSVLGELFFYAAVTLVPMALPLAILLASLMTFGNLGERSELTAIKASGISLLKVMRPLIILVMAVAVGAFFFQNDILPKAQVKMWTLLFSMKQKSPEVEIPEGVFYDQIPGYNLYVKTKNRDTGVLYNVMIYDISKGGDNSTILLADSARMALTKDSRYLYLHLFKGEMFENLREQRSLDRNVPFRREEFYDKEILIPFDANFNRLDEGGMRRQYVGKNMAELQQTIDSINVRLDSIGQNYAADLKSSAFPGVIRSTYFYSSEDKEKDKDITIVPLNIDSLLAVMTPAHRGDLYSTARSMVKSRMQEMEFRAMTVADEKRSIRRHEIELIKKFTLSVACIIFFFIGAPLGAIIRKGGLGTPLVISVLLFLVYYIIDNTGYKMARDGRIAVWIGMWLSTSILLPLGIFVTYKAMNDSSVFNKDLYVGLIRRWFGLQEKRHVPLKEVIINEVSSRRAEAMLMRLYGEARIWLRRNGRVLSYRNYWERGYRAAELIKIGEMVDETVNYLSDSRDLKVNAKLDDFPVIKPLWIYHTTSRQWLRKTLEYFIPVGGVIYLLSLPYCRRLRAEFSALERTAMAEWRLFRDIDAGKS
ncbi:MAG: LptF/LptG family permease [Muribaculaceae bacterium]|nr:LptF/LptG family permease [Muribaculaceae bacterium]